MKKIITTLVILLAGISFAMAMPGSRSMLRLRLNTGRQIMVNIDDRIYDKHAASITIGDLPPGRHRIKVYEYRPYRNSRGGRAELVYTTVIKIRPNTYTYGTVDVDNGLLRLYYKDMDDYYAHRDDYDRGDYGDRTYNDDRDNNYNDNNGYNDNRPGGGYNDNDGYNNDRNNNYDDRGGYDNGRYSRNMLSSRDLEDLRARVNDRITDTDKEKLMKSVLDNRGCTTDQVRTMMGWMSFESTKLDFAKWAFDRVADRRNYWKLESEFTFSSSKDEFNDYIKGK
jgi:hypothetical protein